VNAAQRAPNSLVLRRKRTRSQPTDHRQEPEPECGIMAMLFLQPLKALQDGLPTGRPRPAQLRRQHVLFIPKMTAGPFQKRRGQGGGIRIGVLLCAASKQIETVAHCAIRA
jgi:hypothetical protein